MSLQRITRSLCIGLAMTAGLAFADVARFQQSMKANNTSFSSPVLIHEGAADGFVLITTPQFERPFGITDDAMVSGNSIFWKRHQGQRQVPLTRDELDQLRTRFFTGIRTDQLLGPFGKGGQTVVVMTAPNCPACRNMEADLKKYASQLDVTIFYVPILLGDDQSYFGRQVLCSPDPMKVWRDSWVRQQRATPTPSCLRAAHNEFVSQMMVTPSQGDWRTSTPTVLRADGTLSTGWPKDATLTSARKILGLSQ